MPLATAMLAGFWGLLFLFAFVPKLEAEEFQGRVTFRVKVDGKQVLGRPVEFTSHHLIMLRRDGRMMRYQLDQIDEVKKIANHFQPYSPQKLNAHYRKMFGDRYEVTTTRYYVVVHPKGLRSQWADPFDELHNRFSHYFAVRSFTMRQPEFPLVVVVFNTRSEFNRVARKDGMSNPNSYAGYYSPTSNWIVTYKGVANGSGKNWEENGTLIHEALHQFAFNRGIHQRWAPTPKWCAEGLASMFEAKGVNDSRNYRNESDQLNRVYVQMLKQLVDQPNFRGMIRSLVESDRQFDASIGPSYATAWGLAYYLSSTRSGDFDRYMQKVAKRPALRNYSSADRLADFASEFGSDFTMLESHFIRFIKGLK